MRSSGPLVRVRYLPDPAAFKLFAGVVLLYVGGRMIVARLGAERMGGAAGPGRSLRRPGDPAGATITVTGIGRRRICYVFAGQEYAFSTPGALGLSLVVGMVGGTYGIGGGAIIAPLLVTWFRLPVHSVAGAALAGTGVTSVAAVISYQAIALLDPTTSIAPNWTLGLLFGLGGMAGMYLGARCQRRVPARAIEWMLSLILVTVAVRYIFGFFE